MIEPSDQSAGEPASQAPDSLELLRRAVASLQVVSVDAVRRDVERIDRPFEKQRLALTGRYERLACRLGGRLERLERQLQQARQEAVRQIEERYRAEIEWLEKDAAGARERVVGDVENALRQAREKRDQEIWLAESVVEAEKAHLQREAERLKAERPTVARVLAEAAEQAEWTVAACRMALPEVPPAGMPAADDDPAATFRTRLEQARALQARLEALSLPALFRGGTPYVLALAPTVAAGGAIVLLGATGLLPARWIAPVLLPAAGLTAAVTWIAGRWLRRIAEAQVCSVYIPLRQALQIAESALQGRIEAAQRDLLNRGQAILAARDEAVRKAREEFERVMAGLGEQRKAALAKIDETFARVKGEIEARREEGLRSAAREHDGRGPRLRERYTALIEQARRRGADRGREMTARHDAARAALERRWREATADLERLREAAAGLERLLPAWEDPLWQRWEPSPRRVEVIRFGTFRLDLDAMDAAVRAATGTAAAGGCLAFPALLDLAGRASLLIETDQQGLAEAIGALRSVMVRLLTSLPPGRVRFTIIDPVGLGENFAGLMHLADHDESLVGGRIWTEAVHIEQQLANLTGHMENVIQKYLRNEFRTIEEYNRQAGELAEPYRFLVVANFPTHFTDETARRLCSIVGSGARCGVHALVVHDRRQPLPAGFQIEDLRAHSVHVARTASGWSRQEPGLERVPLTLDAPPPEELLTRLMHAAGRAARESLRVEVPFETIAPDDGRLWSLDSREELRVPVGRSGAVRLQHLRLGRGVAQHALIAGKTGSGKSTLLHVVITNLVLWYPPDEVEFYLVDFKKGVEFKTYAAHELAHARAVAIESDREFGLSVLQRLDEEMDRRGAMFRSAGVQDLAAWRTATGRKLPRTLLIVDEFQVFFSEDDKLAQDAAVLLDRLVRQGRAFGIHVILGSQTLGGTSGLPRSTIGQMAVRIALQCSEADSQLILDDENTAARLLSRPGEAIYNDAGGRVEGNSPFQTAWLSDEVRDRQLDRAAALARRHGVRRPPPVVFEGNAPAAMERNSCLADPAVARRTAVAGADRIWLGEAVAIKEPTCAVLRRQSGANLLLVGQRDDAAAAMMCAALVGLVAVHGPGGLRFVLLDGSPPDAPMAGRIEKTAARLGQPLEVVEYRDVPQTFENLAAEMRRRLAADERNAAGLYVLINGLQRFRTLRRREDDFSFTRTEAEAGPRPDLRLAELLREGPPLGIHFIVWADTLATLERTLDRQTLREFDHRVLFQMSAADSSTLIDSPVANRLGFHRAVWFSEEQGVLEKFRPYGPPDEAFLDRIARRLSGDPSGGQPAG